MSSLIIKTAFDIEIRYFYHLIIFIYIGKTSQCSMNIENSAFVSFTKKNKSL